MEVSLCLPSIQTRTSEVSLSCPRVTATECRVNERTRWKRGGRTKYDGRNVKVFYQGIDEIALLGFVPHDV